MNLEKYISSYRSYSAHWVYQTSNEQTSAFPNSFLHPTVAWTNNLLHSAHTWSCCQNTAFYMKSNSEIFVTFMHPLCFCLCVCVVCVCVCVCVVCVCVRACDSVCVCEVCDICRSRSSDYPLLWLSSRMEQACLICQVQLYQI